MKPGDRIGVVGPNGAGKTTLVRTILGEIAARRRRGRRRHQHALRVPRSGARRICATTSTVLEEVADGNEHVFLDDGPVHVRTFLRMMLFDDGFADTPVGALSAASATACSWRKLFRRGGNLLVLDEPTNDLDLVTLGVLEEALASFPGCALVVSHDRWFLDKVATGILAFEGDGQVEFYEGDCRPTWHARQPAQTPAPKPQPSAVRS